MSTIDASCAGREQTYAARLGSAAHEQEREVRELHPARDVRGDEGVLPAGLDEQALERVEDAAELREPV
jgi:hypothetical protein